MADELWLDCQSDWLAHLSDRFVVPLLKPEHAPKPSGWLNPTLWVAGEPVIMMTQFSGAVPVRDLRSRVASLADDHDAIIRALDTLIGTA